MNDNKKNKFKFHPQKQFKSIVENIDLKTVIKTVFWTLLTIASIIFLVLFMNDRTNGLEHVITDPNKFFVLPSDSSRVFISIKQVRDAIKYADINDPADLNSAYAWMNANIKFPLIDFSLMLWNKNLNVPSSTPYDIWSIRWTNTSKSYTYMFITAVFAIIAWVMLLYINFYKYYENKRVKRYGLSVKYSTTRISYSSYSIKTITDFIINLATVFSFFNFVSTLIIVVYWSILFSILCISKWYGNKHTKNTKEIHLGIKGLTPDSKTMVYLICIMLFQNIYTLLQHYFINIYGVNLDIVLSTILPIGTVTVILVVFIRQLMESKLGWLTKSMKTINSQTNDFQIYLTHSGKSSIEDYDFIRNIPSFVKKQLTNESITTEEAYSLLLQVNKIVYKIKKEFEGRQKLRNYLLYVLFSLIRYKDELDEFDYNLDKIIAHHKTKKDKASMTLDLEDQLV